MRVMPRFFGGSSFGPLLAHTKKVHECVQLLRPITDALIEGDYPKIEQLHHEMSRLEHEADEIKTNIRDEMSKVLMFSIRREDLMRFLSYQDDVADSAEDYAVVALLRDTKVPAVLKEDFQAFVDQVVAVSDHLLNLSEELSLLAGSAFSGEEAHKFLEGIEAIGAEEWKADKLQRKFARHFYQIESDIDPVTLIFLDKYSSTLSAVANSAEKTAKYLRQIVGGN